MFSVEYCCVLFCVDCWCVLLFVVVCSCLSWFVADYRFLWVTAVWCCLCVVACRLFVVCAWVLLVVRCDCCRFVVCRCGLLLFVVC